MLLSQSDDPGRAVGRLAAAFAASRGRTRIERLHESGGFRLRFPTSQTELAGAIVNTAGGMVDGDRLQVDLALGECAEVVVSTPAAEKIYRAENERSLGVATSISLTLGAGAALRWLPQETIMFDRARLQRRIDASIAADARLTLCESTVFGRLASGETNISGSLRDRWRVRRESRLVFAEDMSIGGALSDVLDRPACGHGARACALFLYVAPDAENHLARVRAHLEDFHGVEWGASAWDAMLVVRILAVLPQASRAALETLVSIMPGGTPDLWR